MLQITHPYPQFFGLDAEPLTNGSIYIGITNTNPEINPVAVYWDDLGTMPAAQPLKTSGGCIVRNGTPARVYVTTEDYSITVKDSKGSVVITVLDSTALSNLQQNLALNTGSSMIGYIQSVVGAVPRIVQDKLRETVSVKDFGAVGNGVADDTVAIQTAINRAAVEGFIVFIPRGTYLISAPLQYPTAVGSLSVEITGEKSEQTYDWQLANPASFSVVLKASAVISSVLTARVGITATLAPYAKLRNVALDGNGKAEYGYINGGQDRVRDVTAFNCSKSGVYLGTYTNSTTFTDCSFIANQEHGAVLDGSWSTVSIWNRCKFRGNGQSGATIYSAIGTHFTDCIFENNVGTGTTIYRSMSTSEIQVLNVQFSKCYWEQNSPVGGHQILVDGVAGAAASTIIFDEPHINSGAAGKLGVVISQGNNIKFNTPLFTGDDLTTPGWFSVGASAAEIEINGLTDIYTDPSTMTIDGTGAGDIRINGFKTIGAKGSFHSLPLQAGIIKRQVNLATGRTLLPKEVCGTVITNFGQPAGAQIDYIPRAEAGMSFIAVVQTANAAYWAIQSVDGAVIYLNGVAYTYVTNAPATVGAAIRFTAVIGPAFGWIAEVISGTWTGG